MSDLDGQVISNRYHLLDKLGKGGMGAVYRAYDRLQRQTVALKRVLRPTDQLDITSQPGQGTTYTQVALAHEFQMLASLRHPHIISVLDYGFDDRQQPYLTMTLLEEARSITQAGRGAPLETKVKLLIEMLQALVYLHRRGIVHRDLKPDNALVTLDDQVKVLDFGISIKREQVGKDSEEGILGTLAYLAPEVLQGDPVSEATDLYAVGVIAYELFAGRHPFDGERADRLIRNILLTPIDVRTLDVSAQIADIVQRLLQKSPRARYQSAQEVIAALSQGIDQAAPPETAAIRESFLQAAQFVGRDKELALLAGALAKALDRQGSAWLVGGESGVGKSRLLSELRTQALVKGALVLHGQGVAEGRLTYQLWREPLRRLALGVEISDFEAGVLKQIVPDIGDLLGRPIPDAPELDGRDGQQRLIGTIIDLFRRQCSPVVLMLEDLHWAVESLDVLKQLKAMTGDWPLLIIGNYRDDEKPDLPGELPGMQVIKLERLTNKSIAELSVSMLGTAGRQPHVLTLLEKETEGNIFFLVEIVRALSEEAGQLSQIGQMTLPEHVLAGGVQQIVQRRLNRVPGEARSLLRVAAVAGRQLDLAVLRAIDSHIDIEEWLAICSNAGVLDVMDERWRFAHDKLREGLLSALGFEERRAYHRQLAVTLGTVYAHDQNEYAAMISDHYEQAGELARAADWYAKAGKHAQTIYAPQSAIAHYRKALALWDQGGGSPEEYAARQIGVYHGLGEMLIWQARYREAAEAFTAMCAAAQTRGDQVGQARAWRGLAATQMYQGDFRSALDYISRSEEIARATNAQSELSKTLWMQGWTRFYLGEVETALALGEQVLKLSEEQGDRTLTAQGLNLLTAIHGTLGRFEQAAQECQRALTIFQELGAQELSMFQVGNLGLIAGKRGDHQTAMTHFRDALARARKIGRRDAEMLYLNNLGGGQVRLGAYAEAETNLLQVIHMSESTKFGQLSETYCFLAEVYLGQGKIQQALQPVQRALELGRKSQSTEVVAAAWRVLGEVVACLQEPVVIPDDSGSRPLTAGGCFTESDRICRETGMEGERAHTLRAWARYELGQGDLARGRAMWFEARDIFVRLGATLEAAHMADLPLSSA